MENTLIGEENLLKYTYVAHSNRVKVMVLHKMFLKDTVNVSFGLIDSWFSMWNN